MADKYQAFVSGGLGKNVATRLGLPRPALLRRTIRPRRCCPEPFRCRPWARALSGRWSADALACGRCRRRTVDDEQLPLRRGGRRRDRCARRSPGWPACATSLAGVLRRVQPSGRVVVFGTAPSDHDERRDGRGPAGAGRHRPLAGQGIARRQHGQPGLFRCRRPIAHHLGHWSRGAVAGRGGIDAAVLAVRAVPPTWTGRSCSLGNTPRPTPRPTGTGPWLGRVALVTGAARGIGAAIARPRWPATVRPSSAPTCPPPARPWPRSPTRFQRHDAAGRHHLGRRPRPHRRASAASPRRRRHRRPQRRHHPRQDVGQHEARGVDVGARRQPGRAIADQRRPDRRQASCTTAGASSACRPPAASPATAARPTTRPARPASSAWSAQPLRGWYTARRSTRSRPVSSTPR